MVMFLAIQADSVSIPLFISKPYKTPLLYAASEAEVGDESGGARWHILWGTWRKWQKGWTVWETVLTMREVKEFRYSVLWEKKAESRDGTLFLKGSGDCWQAGGKGLSTICSVRVEPHHTWQVSCQLQFPACLLEHCQCKRQGSKRCRPRLWASVSLPVK